MNTCRPISSTRPSPKLYLFTSRQDWLKSAHKLLVPYLLATERGCKDSDGEMPTSGCSSFARWLEGFTRPMTLAAPLLEGCSGAVSLALPDGRRIDLADWYRQQLTMAMEGNDEQKWPIANRDMDQTIVEASILCYCLNIAKASLWDPLPLTIKYKLTQWLTLTAQRFTLNINNWNLFPVIIHVGLCRLGMSGNLDTARALLKQVEKFYHGDGWYADGYGRQFDYYVPEAIYLLLMIADWLEDGGQLRAAIHQRAGEFAKDFESYFDSHGRCIFFGRSCTYRFAASFFWALCAKCEVAGIDPGKCRRILSDNISWFVNRPIFSEDGRIAPGYAYCNERVAENYIGPGSSAWALQSFLPLALPAGSPFWTQPIDTCRSWEVRPLKQLNSAITITGDGCNCTLYNAGIYHPFNFGNHPAKYGKIAYSSHFGVNMGDHHQHSFDSAITVSSDEGETWSHRAQFEILSAQGEWLITRHQPFKHLRSTHITTAIIINGNWHVRVHRLQLEIDLVVRDGGTAVCGASGNSQGNPDTSLSDNSISLTGDNGRVAAVCLLGLLQPSFSGPQTNVNVLHRRVYVPYLESWFSAGYHVIATAHFAAAVPTEYDASANCPRILKLATGAYLLEWTTGQTDTLNILDGSVEVPVQISKGFPWP